MIARTIAAAVLAVTVALPAAAQEPTLADLRAELTDLRGQLQSLRSELVASGAAGFQAAGGDAAIDRMNAMEQRLARLTDRTEQLQNRIDRIVADGSRRIADIEFRLCEMDEGCDLAALTMQDLGRAGSPVPNLGPATPQAGGAPGPAAAGEQADFDAAKQVMATGDFRRAADMFGAVAEAHAGGALTAEALFLRGAALDSSGDTKGAAAAWLEGFAADPDGPRAAESLLGIARVIADEGDPTAACLYLAEIPARFPGTPFAIEAETRLSRLACSSNDLGMAAEGAVDPADVEAEADLTEHQ
ncbi:tol-pal system protein [Paracoccus benzoatiresistens]|uniref:Cell division coordinator CpoB n=1 Tax=Paracoccus benzoatiresistens TaxID=2997341 RepID=A0ABT4J4V5_9RHOB|nr:tol-pal system protein [Paracoccus sp. EF6]MCZ0962129.1 tol-pal system protein [Paracoccus sp. EF6]